MSTLALASAIHTDGPEDLAEQISRHYQQAELGARDMITHALAAGRLLHQAKLTIDHGAWTDWLVENFPGSQRTANKWMQLAQAQRETPQVLETLPDRTLTSALVAITKPTSPDSDHTRLSQPAARIIKVNPDVETHVLTIDQLAELVHSMGGHTTLDRVRRWIERLTEPKATTCPDCQQPVIRVNIKGQTILASPYEWQPRTVCTKCLQTRNAHPGSYVHCPHCNNTGHTGTQHRPPGPMLAMDMAWSDTPNLRIIGQRTDRREGEALHQLHDCPAQHEEAA